MFERIIGIEIHCELKTSTKMYSGTKLASNYPANSLVNEVDIALPGVLPTVNKKAIELAIKACHAFNLEIDPLVRFDRKNYYYSDLPKGYQITQQFYPIGKNGYLISGDKKFRINRIHMEEDTAKQFHLSDKTLIDFNRAGTPLIEIVSEADMRSGEDAVAYLTKVKAYLEYLNISDVKMEEGSLRADVNISLRPYGSNEFGNKVEIKNINSFNHVLKAIEFETKRQSELLLKGEVVVQETRRFDEKTNTTIAMRSKESSLDYKYFPEPNIIPILLDTNWIADIKATMEELPDHMEERFKQIITEYDAKILIENKKLALLFDQYYSKTSNPKILANYLISDYSSLYNEEAKDIMNFDDFVQIINLVSKDEISSKQAKQMIRKIYHGDNLQTLLKATELISDEKIITEMVMNILNSNQQSIEDYKNGKTNALKYLQGQMMKESKGKINPKIANQILIKKLEEKCHE